MIRSRVVGSGCLELRRFHRRLRERIKAVKARVCQFSPRHLCSRQSPADKAPVTKRIPSNVRIQHKTRRLLRSEEHTSELQSQSNLVCRLLLEKKKKKKKNKIITMQNIQSYH